MAQIDPVSDDDRRRADTTWSRADTSDPDATGHHSSPDLGGLQPAPGVMGTQPAGEIEDLYRTYRQPMVRLAQLLTSSPATAEEIVHEAFIKFAGSAGKKEQPAAYLRVIVINLCRSQQRRTLVERRLAPKAPVLSGVTEIDETWDVVRRLPFRQRAALMLRYYEDLTEADIARALGCRPGTVKSALHRGLAALRKELGDLGEEPARRRPDG